jgi:serine/threonine protein kinase
MNALDTSREEQLGAIFVDWLECVERGETRDRQQWLAGHADFAVELDACLADEERLQALAAPLREVARAGRMTGPTPPAMATPFAAPASFGDYELLEKIGQGGMGVVYRARQKSLGRFVALKLCRAAPGDGAEELTRFHHEAAMIAQLDHPHVVPIHEVGEYQGYVYFSMKWLEGGGLDAQLDRFRADPRGSANVLVAAARAVHHAHQHAILHRDLKPSNILLDHAGNPHVTDFGLAK